MTDMVLLTTNEFIKDNKKLQYYKTQILTLFLNSNTLRAVKYGLNQDLNLHIL